MRILVIAVGSRGDVAPFIGLGQGLRAAGHRVTIAAYGMFADLVRENGLEFRTLPGDPRVLGASEQGQRWQRGGGGPVGTARFLRLVDEHMADVNAGILEAARQGTDVMLVTGQPQHPRHAPSARRRTLAGVLRVQPDRRTASDELAGRPGGHRLLVARWPDRLDPTRGADGLPGRRSGRRCSWGSAA